MKKIIVNDYGSVDVLQEVSAPKPIPGKNDVLIKVAAIGVNDPDVVMRKYGPFPTMPVELRPTLPHMLGEDFSGIIERVGSAVTKFQVGDHVMGYAKNGTYAQYLMLDQDSSLSKVPAQLDLVPLGGLYLAALTAWSAIVKNGHLQAGQKVLIHGGAGGVGSMAIQIAKAMGATVITTARKQHHVYLKDLGADQIIDYRTENFVELVHNVDLVVNLTGAETLAASYQVVKAGGRLFSVNGVPDEKQAAAHGITAVYALGDVSAEARTAILHLYEQGKLTVTISQTYPFTLAAVKQAHLDFEKGGNQGKRVIVFDQAPANLQQDLA